MKRSAILLCLFTLLFLPAFGSESSEKHYDPQEIELTEVNLEERTDSVTDQAGLHFLKDKLLCRRTLNPKNTCELPT